MRTKKKRILRGRVRFPTGGIVRDPLRRLIWWNFRTDSIVWMREEHAIFTIRAHYPGYIIRGFLYVE